VSPLSCLRGASAAGVVCDYGLTLADLIGTLQQFFDRLGLKKLRFKPAFNPYTEPSMEIFRWGPNIPLVKNMWANLLLPRMQWCLSLLTSHASLLPRPPPPRCSYSEQLGKWIEVGNSGMFRPEMLRPMGLPEGVNVIAWGLGLER
jgi:phenylalanyl-tRNA synthetase alpha chain